MSRIMLVMQRKIIVQSLIKVFKDNPDIEIIYHPNYYNADADISSYEVNTVLIEATETGPYDMDYCLALCKLIRKNSPKCKLLLICSEQDEKSVEKVVSAKGKKQIDDFVFYDVTIDYLASKLISI